MPSTPARRCSARPTPRARPRRRAAPSAVNGVGIAIHRPLTFSRASSFADDGRARRSRRLILANDCGTVAMHGRDADRTRAASRRISPASRPPSTSSATAAMRAHPRASSRTIQRLFLKGEVHGTTHLSAGPGGGPRRRLLGARARRLRRRHLPRPRARARQGHRPRGARGRDARPGDRGVRRARGLDERRSTSSTGWSAASASSAAASPPPPARRSRRSARAGSRSPSSATAPPTRRYFHECLNFAAGLSTCRSVFVCENNFYGEFTPMAQRHRRRRDRRSRAAAFGMPSHVVDGNDLWAVREAALEAVGRARAGGGPTLLECQTYRHYGHSKSDPAKYRPPDEVERWLARDPLDLARARLLDLGVTEAERSRGEERRDRRADGRARSRTRSRAPYPDPAPRRRHGVQADERRSSSAPRSATRSPRRSSATRRSSSSARTSRPPAACS